MDCHIAMTSNRVTPNQKMLRGVQRRRLLTMAPIKYPLISIPKIEHTIRLMRCMGIKWNTGISSAKMDTFSNESVAFEPFRFMALKGINQFLLFLPILNTQWTSSNIYRLICPLRMYYCAHGNTKNLVLFIPPLNPFLIPFDVHNCASMFGT